ATRRDTLNCRIGADCNAAAAASIEQTLIVECRVNTARAFDDQAAVVVVAGDLVALTLARHHVGVRLSVVVEATEPALLIGEMLWRPGADKPPALLPEAVDPFLFNQPFDQPKRVTGVRQHAGSPLRIALGGAAAKALTDINATTDCAAITGAGAFAERPL